MFRVQFSLHHPRDAGHVRRTHFCSYEENGAPRKRGVTVDTQAHVAVTGGGTVITFVGGGPFQKRTYRVLR